MKLNLLKSVIYYIIRHSQTLHIQVSEWINNYENTKNKL